MRMSAANKAAIAPPTNLIEEDKKAEMPAPQLSGTYVVTLAIVAYDKLLS